MSRLIGARLSETNPVKRHPTFSGPPRGLMKTHSSRHARRTQARESPRNDQLRSESALLAVGSPVFRRRTQMQLSSQEGDVFSLPQIVPTQDGEHDYLTSTIFCARTAASCLIRAK